MPLGGSAITPAKAKWFGPLLLPAVLHKIPWGYAQRLKKFTRERDYLVEEHLGWFVDWNDLEEVDHDDIKVILFAQIFAGEAIRWLSSLLDSSILLY